MATNDLMVVNQGDAQHLVVVLPSKSAAAALTLVRHVSCPKAEVSRWETVRCWLAGGSAGTTCCRPVKTVAGM
jgi:hypothetical protein